MSRSPLFEHDSQLAEERLRGSDFFTKSIESLHLPRLMRAANGNRPSVPYVLFGEPDAPNVILQTTPYLTDVNSEHYKVHLAAQKTVLGGRYAVVGVQAYDAVDGRYDRKDRKAFGCGDFSPLSARMFRVAEALKLKSHQRVLPYGDFMGADVAVQTAHDAIFSERRGVVSVKALGVFEFVRAAKRGAVAVARTIARSRKNMFADVFASDVNALDEAWGIDHSLVVTANEQAFDERVKRAAITYLTRGVLNNIQLAHGFGTDRSVEQIGEIALPGDKTYVLVGRQDRSTVCPEVDDARLVEAQTEGGLEVLVEGGGRSAAHTLLKSATRVLYFANQVDASFD